MATQYKISLGHYNISFTKLDTDEYEFSTVYNYMEYYGKSYLKSLAFVTDFNSYLSNMSNAIKIKHIDESGSIMIELPIPFSDKLEIVSLKIVDVDEFKKLNAIILRNSDEIKKEITVLKNKTDASVAEVLNSQLKTNGEIMGRIKTLEKNYAALSSEVKELKHSQKKYYIYGDSRPCSWTYSNADHAKIITRMHEEKEKQINPEPNSKWNPVTYMMFLGIMGKAGFIITPASCIKVRGDSFKYSFEYTIDQKFDNIKKTYLDDLNYKDDYSKSFLSVIEDEIRTALLLVHDDMLNLPAWTFITYF